MPKTTLIPTSGLRNSSSFFQFSPTIEIPARPLAKSAQIRALHFPPTFRKFLPKPLYLVLFRFVAAWDCPGPNAWLAHMHSTCTAVGLLHKDLTDTAACLDCCINCLTLCGVLPANQPANQATVPPGCCCLEIPVALVTVPTWWSAVSGSWPPLLSWLLSLALMFRISLAVMEGTTCGAELGICLQAFLCVLQFTSPPRTLVCTDFQRLHTYESSPQLGYEFL